MADPDEKEPRALQNPEIHQWVLQAYPEGNIRAGMKRERWTS